MKRLVVLISGNGSNLQAILDACASGELNARVVAVISNKADAFGLTRARRANVHAIFKAKDKTQDRRAYDAELAELVASFEPDFIILAGWMRILSSAFLDKFPMTRQDASRLIETGVLTRHTRVVNLHPALPDTFPGTHAIERAFDAFQRGEISHTGVMVHLVPDEGVDNGPVLAQEVVPIEKDDTLEMLEARIHQVEHRLLVDTIKRLDTRD